MMVAVKVATVRARLFGAGGPVQDLLVRTFHDVNLETARAIVRWAREWVAMSPDEVTAYQDAAYRHVNEERRDDATWENKGDRPIHLAGGAPQ
jgi:hypothetical protein